MEFTWKSEGRLDFFLEKNKRACPFIRELRVLILISFKINTKRFHVRTRNRFMKENTVCFIYIVGLSWPTLYINSGPLLMHIKLGFLMIFFVNSKLCFSRVHTNDYNIIKLSTFWPKLFFTQWIPLQQSLNDNHELLACYFYKKLAHVSLMNEMQKTYSCMSMSHNGISAKYYPKILIQFCLVYQI